MKPMSSDLLHGPNGFQFASVQKIYEENDHSSLFLLVSKCFSVLRAIQCLEIGTFVSIKVLFYFKIVTHIRLVLVP